MKQIISTWDGKTNSGLLHKTIQALQKRQKTENTENKNKWDMREKSLKIEARGGGLFLHIPQCIPSSRQEVFNY